MKVLHVIPSVSERSGGPGQAILPMCRALQRQGIEVLLVTTDADLDNGASGGGAGLTSYQNVPTMFFPRQWGNSFKYSYDLAVWLDEHVVEFDVVHIHAVFNHACIAAARACRKHNVPYVVRPLGTLDPWGMNQKSWRKNLFWRFGVEDLMRKASAIHYTSETERRGVEDSLGLNHGCVIPLGVEANEGPLPELNSESENSQHADRPYVLALSRLVPTKGIDVLIEAFLSLTADPQFRNWLLVIAGTGVDAYQQKLKDMVKGANASDRVVFTGWLDGDRKASVLSAASLFALPSSYESFGLSVIEALAWGIPVVISPHVSLANEIEAAGAGWIAKVDPQAFKDCLAQACASREERLARGANARKLAARFEWANIAPKLVALYSSVAARPGVLVQ